MNATPRHALDDFFVRNGNFQDEINGNLGIEQGLGLRNRARETVKQEAVLAIVSRQAFFHKADDDVVTHEFALVHDNLGGFAELGSGFHGSAQHVAGGNLRNTELLFNKSRLGSFSRSGWSNED